MSNDHLDRITNELKGLGYNPFCVNTPKGPTVIIEYQISIGKYNGEKILLGFSFQEDAYPEYPPHWIHISPPYDDQLGGATDPYQQDGREWLALSRPPQEFWDHLPTKHMKYYLDSHISRFCKGLK